VGVGVGEAVAAWYVDFFLAQQPLHGVLESHEQDVHQENSLLLKPT
jgi:hypothetical protein